MSICFFFCTDNDLNHDQSENDFNSERDLYTYSHVMRMPPLMTFETFFPFQPFSRLSSPPLSLHFFSLLRPVLDLHGFSHSLAMHLLILAHVAFSVDTVPAHAQLQDGIVGWREKAGKWRVEWTGRRRKGHVLKYFKVEAKRRMGHFMPKKSDAKSLVVQFILGNMLPHLCALICSSIRNFRTHVRLYMKGEFVRRRFILCT